MAEAMTGAGAAAGAGAARLEAIEAALAGGRLEEGLGLCQAALAEAGDTVRLLHLLVALLKAAGRGRDMEAACARCLALDGGDVWALNELTQALLGRGRLREAESRARQAVRVAPRDAQAHNLIGQVMTEQQRPPVGEYHYRLALGLVAERDPALLANLAWNLKLQGRMAESRALYRECTAKAPTLLPAWVGWARMEEADRDFGAAMAALAQAERLAPGHAGVQRVAATVLGRMGQTERALALLDRLGRSNRDALLEKGRLLDGVGRYDEAWAAWTEAKARTRAETGHAYAAAEAAALVARLRRFFTAARVVLLPRATVRADAAVPIFVLGFPRSGTTLLEQILAGHSRVNAGDELPLIKQVCNQMPHLLGSPLPYPDALTELWIGDRRSGLDILRDCYLHQAADLGVTAGGARYFTDKMPLNEMHLGVISLMFPEAPLVRLRRHPLDVMVSVFSNHLTHGFYCAYDLETAARHYALIEDLVAHYLREMPVRVLDARYEELVRRPEPVVRGVLDHVGVGFEDGCLQFHESRRLARTASYAQVSEPLYDRSVDRFRHYWRHLAPVLPILEGVLGRGGYSV